MTQTASVTMVERTWVRAMPAARDTHERSRNLRSVSALRVGIAIAALSACHVPTQQEREASRAYYDAQRRQDAYDRFYDSCLYRVTGPFAAASIDVMRECERQARNASGMSAFGQDPKGLEAKAASPTAAPSGGDAPTPGERESGD